MPIRRKIFRVEEMVQGGAPDLMPVATAELAMCHHETLRELKALRAMLERRGAGGVASGEAMADEAQLLKSELQQLHETITRTKQEIAALHATGSHGGAMLRVASELGAVVGSTENATQRILAAAETIDTHANTLAADLVSEQHMNITQDIQDGVVRIFEACVFHDLTGQRIAKVTSALKLIEDHVARMIDIWGGPQAFAELVPAKANGEARERPLLNGPRLDEEAGHVTQNEIDAIFAAFHMD
jgi:chemotaxis protein CheZ